MDRPNVTPMPSLWAKGSRLVPKPQTPPFPPGPLGPVAPQHTAWQGCSPSYKTGHWVLGFQAAKPCAADTVVQGTLAICKDSTDLNNSHPPNPCMNRPSGTPHWDVPAGTACSHTLWAPMWELISLDSEIHTLNIRAAESRKGLSVEASPFATAEV